MTDHAIPTWAELKKRHESAGSHSITKITPGSEETGYEDSDINNAIESSAWNDVERANNDKMNMDEYNQTPLSQFLDELAANPKYKDLAQRLFAYMNERCGQKYSDEANMLFHSNMDDGGIPDKIHQGVDENGYIEDREAGIDHEATVRPKQDPTKGKWGKEILGNDESYRTPYYRESNW